MKRMKPQPPDGTAKVQRIGSTDSFDCLGFGADATNYVMLAVVHRPISSAVRPVCKDGVWYWSNAPREGRAVARTLDVDEDDERPDEWRENDWDGWDDPAPNNAGKKI